MKSIAMVLIAVLLVGSGLGCSSKPVLYQNEQYAARSQQQIEADINDCMARADAAGVDKGGGAKDTAVATAGGAAVGAAGGAAGGAIFGAAGRGAATGAIGGAVGGLLYSLFKKKQPNPAYQNYVNRCLQEKGYEPVGWQ